MCGRFGQQGHTSDFAQTIFVRVTDAFQALKHKTVSVWVLGCHFGQWPPQQWSCAPRRAACLKTPPWSWPQGGQQSETEMLLARATFPSHPPLTRSPKGHTARRVCQRRPVAPPPLRTTQSSRVQVERNEPEQPLLMMWRPTAGRV